MLARPGGASSFDDVLEFGTGILDEAPGVVRRVAEETAGLREQRTEHTARLRHRARNAARDRAEE